MGRYSGDLEDLEVDEEYRRIDLLLLALMNIQI